MNTMTREILKLIQPSLKYLRTAKNSSNHSNLHHADEICAFHKNVQHQLRTLQILQNNNSNCLTANIDFERLNAFLRVLLNRIKSNYETIRDWSFRVMNAAAIIKYAAINTSPDK